MRTAEYATKNTVLTLGIAANNVGLTPVNNAARPSLRYIDAIVLNTPRLICCCGSINLSIPDELDILDAAVLVVVIACSRILTTSSGLNARTYIIDPTDPERIRDVGVLIVTSAMLFDEMFDTLALPSNS